jgi:hypothetical protein
MVFGRRFVTGPSDSLGRLKRAAEQRRVAAPSIRYLRG